MADKTLPSKPLNKREKAFLQAAIRLGKSRIGKASPNPSVGAIIVSENEKGAVVLGRGVTADGGRPHGEVVALQQAGAKAKGATCYVSLEPCAHHGKTPPCVEALHKAGIARVIIAMQDPDPRVSGKGSDFLRAHGVKVYDNCAVDEARQANIGHVSRIINSRPFISLKLALSKNNMLGIKGQGMAPITGPLSRRIVHGMRARSDAILVGIETVLADDPDLTCRLNGLENWSPKRFVLDTHARMPLTAKLFDKIKEVPLTVVVGENVLQEKIDTLKKKGAEVLVLPLKEGKLDLSLLCNIMGKEGITHLMVEGGSRVASSFMKEDLVDRAFVFKGDTILRGETVSALPDGQFIEDLLNKNNLCPIEKTIYEKDILTRWERG